MCDCLKGGDCFVLLLCPFWANWNLFYTSSCWTWYVTFCLDCLVKKRRKKNPPRNEIRREKEKGSLIFNDLLFSSSSQDTWRWFRSRKVRSTSRSKSSPCRKITSVSDDLETIAGHMNHQTNVHLASSFMLVVPRRWSSLTFMIPWFSLRRHHEVDVLVSG